MNRCKISKWEAVLGAPTSILIICSREIFTLMPLNYQLLQCPPHPTYNMHILLLFVINPGDLEHMKGKFTMRKFGNCELEEQYKVVYSVYFQPVCFCELLIVI